MSHSTWPLHVTSSLHMTSPLHITPPCDLCTWPLYSLTQFVELSQLNIFLQICQKRTFFRVPKIRSVSTWRITWLFLFTLYIPLNQLSVFTRLTVLHWPPAQLNSTQLVKLGWLNASSRFLQKRNFLGCQGIELSSRDVLHDFFCLCWASLFRFNLAY